MLKKRGEISETAWAPMAVMLALFTYSLTCPMNYSDMGHLFFYPIYSTYGL
jgi:hypothetical protein